MVSMDRVNRWLSFKCGRRGPRKLWPDQWAVSICTSARWILLVVLLFLFFLRTICRSPTHLWSREDSTDYVWSMKREIQRVRTIIWIESHWWQDLVRNPMLRYKTLLSTSPTALVNEWRVLISKQALMSRFITVSDLQEWNISGLLETAKRHPAGMSLSSRSCSYLCLI